MPFDWRTPITYLLAVAYQCIFFLSVLEIFVTFLVIYFGICNFLVAFVSDIEQNFTDFRQKVINCRRKFTAEQQIQLYQSLNKIVEFHSNAIQLSGHQFGTSIRFSNSYSIPMEFFLSSFLHRIFSSFSMFYKPFMSMFFAISTSYLCIFCLRIQSVSENSSI